ncbi:mannose-P-dolichol utilization defect 1 protein-like isoform X2 [Brienomyrus brachyistius]|uniref:mannose-P-dolichol utilization defect 1 protein-like isoform X2 n=1 Tax=Brienomyrus brachyistius TaxID=42636 RepID=UPI0020B40905|nr:mannose-P-dolichol utilization defect 1 protein-like isoform X2 [Brienomyrus brachyistius]
MDAMKSFLLAYFIPEKCYDEFFVRLQLLHVPCLRIALRKTLGIWVMLGSVTAKLPQMFKLLGAKSSEGLSLPSALVELYAAAGTVAVQIGRNFPLEGHTVRGLAFLLLCCCLLFGLFSCTLPRLVLTAVQVSIAPTVVVSRLLQVWTCFQIGHTGQLSALSIFLQFAGSQAQLISSSLDMGELMKILPYAIICCCDGFLAAQMLCYWSYGPGVKKKVE